MKFFFPIIAVLLFYSLKTIFDVENNKFENKEGSIQNYARMRSVYNSDIFPQLNATPNINPSADNEQIIPQIPIMTPEIYGMSIHSAFNICSIFNEKKEIRPLIATIGVPNEIKEKMIYESTRFVLNQSSFKDFRTEEDLDKYIKSENYGETEEMPKICFGISFSQDRINHKYDYSLHYFEYGGQDGSEDVPNTLSLDNQFQTIPDFNSYIKYQYNGYSYIMKIVTDYIYSQEIGNETKINFGIIPMKYESFKKDPFGNLIGEIGSFFMIVAYVSNLGIYVYKMVLEKEIKVKEGMKMMGLTDGLYFLSYFIQYIILSITDSIIISGSFLLLFTKIPFVVLFFMFFLISLSIFSMAFCFQSFIEKTKESLILSLLIYFTMFFFYMLVISENANYSLKIALSLFPPVTIFIGFNLLGKFEANLREFYFKDIFYIYTNYSIFVMYIMLILDCLIYLFIGYYLQNILKHEFGIRKPWYFLFTKKYWGYKETKINAINDEKSNEELLINNEQNINDNFQNEDIYKEMVDPKDCIKIRSIYKKYDDGKEAVKHVSLNLYKNEIFALLGHNGAGKTTLISMLTGLYEATSGEVFYDGMNVLLPENIENFRSKIGICPQHDVLFKDLNAREHLEMFSLFK